LYLFIRRAIKQTLVIKGAYHFYQLRTKFIQHPAVKVNSIRRETYWDRQCGFRHNRSTTDHIFCIRQILEKQWEYKEAVLQLFIDLKKAYGSVTWCGRKVMRPATLCTNRQRCCLPLHMAVRLTPAIDSVQV